MASILVVDDEPGVRSALSAMLAERNVPVVDLEPRLCPDGDCDALRPTDGVHVAPEFATATLDWLVGEALTALRGQAAAPG